MPLPDPICLAARIAQARPLCRIGRIQRIGAMRVVADGLSDVARLGDRAELARDGGPSLSAEVIEVARDTVTLLPDLPPQGLHIGAEVRLTGPVSIAPDDSWLGRVVDPLGLPLDDLPLMPGAEPCGIDAIPPSATARRGFGARLATGLAVFNTLLPLVRGQRVGLFAGSGVGKSMLLARLAQTIEADVVVISLIGERGREVRDFVQHTLGPEGMRRTVVVAATSDRSALLRRNCAKTAMTVAEYFRDKGLNVLLLADSITRFAEAHRELAVASGEAANLRGFPASTAQEIMALCERAGPGQGDMGDITAVMTVLVAGSDMEGPVADILRGVLDGHIVLDREIAERGRYPAVNLLRSVSRSLPGAASESENALISEARQLLGAYDRSEIMVQSGLYSAGSDPLLDRAVALWPRLDGFLAEGTTGGIAESFLRLRTILAGQG